MSRLIDPGFDPRIADWLEADPDRAPADLMRTVESALPSIPQRRAFRPPWRFPTMSRFAAIAAAAVLLALAGLGLLATGSRQPAPPPTSPPALEESPSPSIAPTASSLTTNLTRPYTSPLYGYTIGTDPSWTVKPGSLLADDPRGTGDTSYDAITIPGTDTTVNILAWNLRDKTAHDWITQYHADVSKTVPFNCDGGDPSTWPAVPVGDHQGVWEQLCNAAEAIVNVGDWVYVFAWNNDTFDAAQHFQPSDFKRLLETVTLPASATSSRSPRPSPRRSMAIRSGWRAIGRRRPRRSLPTTRPRRRRTRWTRSRSPAPTRRSAASHGRSAIKPTTSGPPRTTMKPSRASRRAATGAIRRRGRRSRSATRRALAPGVQRGRGDRARRSQGVCVQLGELDVRLGLAPRPARLQDRPPDGRVPRRRRVAFSLRAATTNDGLASLERGGQSR